MVPPDPPASPPATSGPPTLQPPASTGRSDGGSGHRLAWLALAVLVVVGVAVVVVLPRIVNRPDETNHARSEATDASVGAGEDATSVRESGAEGSADRAAARAEAEQTLADYLKLRARLELAGAAVWGEPEWTQSAARAIEGDSLFGYQRFRLAAVEYANARNALGALAASREDRLVAALSRAETALAENRSQTAIEEFEIALAIEPEHTGASAGLARARVRDEVVAWVRDGDRAERAGDLEAAREAYAKAAVLDAAYPPTVEGLARVTAAVVERDFREAMTRALVDIDAGRFDAAVAALDTAVRLRPEDRAVADARRSLVSARERAELERLRKQVAARERAENWSGAVTIYETALKLAPSAGFAREGVERARERARLNEQVDYYLDDPERLYSPDPLVHAQDLIDSAGAIPADEPKLEAKVEELERQVRMARSPVLVTVRSDGETEVAIYHVARLGRFEERSLELRPGSYTVVGARPGYRDVRRVIDLKPGSAPVPVVIRCEERI
jgi:tetratricopeptide (TPR) repeat protein